MGSQLANAGIGSGTYLNQSAMGWAFLAGGLTQMGEIAVCRGSAPATHPPTLLTPVLSY